MAMHLKGGRILVTGASRGLGRALALAYAKAGARVAICARGAAELERAAEEIRAGGGSVVHEALSVTDPEPVSEFVARVVAGWGGIDALVNNASLLGARVPLRDYPLSEWRRVLDVNVTGALVPTQAVLPVMRESQSGSIINVSSGVGNRPRTDWGAYAVSKWAVEAFTYNLALEEADAGIRANVVDPGAMRTRMRRAAYPEEDPATLPEPDDVTGIFLWLASDAAADVTGQRFSAREWRRPA